MNSPGPEEVLRLGPFAIQGFFYPSGRTEAAMLFLPALGTPAGYYQPFAEALRRRGCSVLLSELPGTGESRPRPSRNADYGYRDLVESYLPELADRARHRFGGVPLLLAGHSLGAHVVSLGVLSGAVRAEGLVTLAGGHIHYRHWNGPGAAAVLFTSGVVDALANLFAYVPAQLIGLGAPQPRTLMREWARTIRTGRLPYSAAELQAGEKLPALAIAYEGDSLAPSESVKALARLISAGMVMLPAPAKGKAHAGWARTPDTTVDRIVNWLRSEVLA